MFILIHTLWYKVFGRNSEAFNFILAKHLSYEGRFLEKQIMKIDKYKKHKVSESRWTCACVEVGGQHKKLFKTKP